jgi:hypothetical protein
MEILDVLADRTTPEALIAFHPSEQLQARIDDLAARKSEDLLSPEEEQELTDFLNLEHLLIIAKAEACRRLHGRNQP